MKNRETSTNLVKWIMILSLALAVLLAISGLILSGLSYLGLIIHPKLLNRIGTFLVLFAAPFYFLAAHCLDRFDLLKRAKDMKSKKTGRLSYGGGSSDDSRPLSRIKTVREKESSEKQENFDR